MGQKELFARRYLIDGRVQGVGFRWFTKKAADELGLNGFVRNLPDGRVEALAVGDHEQLKAFRFRIDQGPSYSLVTSVAESPVGVTKDYNSFEITY